MVDWEGEGKVMPDFAKLEGKGGRRAQHGDDLPQWAARQQKVFTNWINNKVADRQLTVCDLFVDLQDGTVLYGLLEVLSKQSLASLGRVKPEKHKIKKIANMNIVWKYLSNTVRLVGIGPTDIVDGNVTLTLGMIWSLIVFFMAKDLGDDSGDGLGVLKKRILEWMRKRTRDYPDVKVTDFTSSLADGKAFLAMLDDYDPEECPYDPSDSPSENLRTAFESFERLFQVGSILDPDDPQCCEDEKANITYLAELMKAMPMREEDEEDGEGRRRVIRERHPRKAALKRAAKLFPGTVDKLRQLCAFGPADGEACARKVAELMESIGLTNVEVVTPSGPQEDPSLRGDPFIVGERPGPPGSPTVLFYSSYGTADETRLGLSIRGGESTEQDGDGVRDWATDPLSLTSATGVAEEDPGARLAARGAAQDKGSVVWQLAAVEALLQAPSTSSLPCGVKVIVGGSPPPGTMVGNGKMAVSDRLADFLRAHPSIAGSPDLVVVSEPGGAFLAPGKSAVVVGCRGFASMEVSVSAFDEAKESRSRDCAELGGPLIDPGRILASVLASMHDASTGALKVEGLSSPPDNLLRRQLKTSVHCKEQDLRPATGYLSNVSCAKEVYVKDGQPTPASIPEQLTLLPAVAVTSMSMPAVRFSGGGGAGGVGGPLGSAFPCKATAGIHVCLPPGMDYMRGVQAMEAHFAKHTPYGAKLVMDKIQGCTGWLTPPGSRFVETVLTSRLRERGSGDEAEGRGEAREAVLASNSGFSPIPCAFSQALPSSVLVVGLGVNDPEANAGQANESVLVGDLRDLVEGAVRMMHDLPKSGQRTAEDGKAPEELSAEALASTSSRVSGSSAGGTPTGCPVSPSRPHLSPGFRSAATPPRHATSPVARAVTPTRARTSSASGSQHLPGAGYAHRMIDDMERRNQINQLRGRKSDTVAGGTSAPSSLSPMGRAGNLRPGSGTSPTSPVFPHGTSSKLSPRHPLSPVRRGAASSSFTGSASAVAALSTDSSFVEPESPSAEMAAYASSVLGQMGTTEFGPSGAAGEGPGMGRGRGFGLAASPPPPGMSVDDDVVGGATPEKVVVEINELRTDPRKYAAKLEALEQHYEGNLFKSPTGPPMYTTDGPKALREAIEALKTAKPLHSLETKEGMRRAATEHARDLVETSRTGHSGSDGSKASDRMNRYGQFFEIAGEVCSYYDATPEGIVAQLLISDGERSRHNRRALLAAHFKCCGVAISPHPTVGVVCVITLSGGYGPKPLDRAARVVCEPGKAPSAEFLEVLRSIPYTQITDEVEKCLEAGIKVELDYAPGQVKCTFVQKTGAGKSMACKWS